MAFLPRVRLHAQWEGLCVNTRRGGLAEKSLCLNTVSLSKYPLHFSPSGNPRSHSAAANSRCTGDDPLKHYFHHFHSAIIGNILQQLIHFRKQEPEPRNSSSCPANDLALNQKTFKFVCQFRYWLYTQSALILLPISLLPIWHSALLAACFPHCQPSSWLAPCSLSHPSVSIH